MVTTKTLLPFFFSSRRRHTRWPRDWSSDVCSSDLPVIEFIAHGVVGVDCDAHPVVLSDFTGEGSKCQRTGDHVVNIGTGKVFCPTVGNLNDAVGFGFSKATQRGVERL